MSKDGYFPITSVHKEDLKELYREEVDDYMYEKIIDDLDDNEMKYLAKKMADAYCESGFWIDLKEIFEGSILSEKLEKYRKETEKKND